MSNLDRRQKHHPLLGGFDRRNGWPVAFPSFDALYKMEEAAGARVDFYGGPDLDQFNDPGRDTGFNNGDYALDLVAASQQRLQNNSTLKVFRPADRSWTCAMQIRMASDPGGDGFALFIAADWAGQGEHAILWIDSGKNLIWQFKESNSPYSFQTITWATTLSTATWYSIRCGIDVGGGNPNRTYLEAREEGGSSSTQFTNIGSVVGIDVQSDLYVGRSGAGLQSFMNGRIDNLGFREELLSNAEFDAYATV